MAYCYQDPSHDIYAYKYSDNGNQGNNEYEYELYTNHAKPNHIPSKPDHGQYNNVQHHIDADYEDPMDQWETECEVHEHEAYEPKGFEHGGDEIYELRELRCKGKVIHRDGYKLGELKCDKDRIEEREELKCEGEYKSTMLEYETTEELAHEPEYSARANYGSYGPQGSEQGDYKTPQHGYEGMIRYVHPDHLPRVPTTPIVYHNLHTPTTHHPTPTYVPPSPSHTPPPPTHVDTHALTLGTKSDNNHPSNTSTSHRTSSILHDINIDAFRCIADQHTRPLSYHTKLITRSTSILHQFRRPKSHISPLNDHMILFQGSDSTSTSISARSQRNDGISLSEFHWTSVDLRSRHYRSSRYRW
ncbi:hypothetical protein PILCRDRAFT_3169 [Piloderma croceum F 1598]|uniref:Uncharacterized protein n=1 Tax=Piloderma croceum (strain F 1598) TaxID=765440 RepID=A0A0C3CEI5_PILCF|nr:hypothetical protein PILCRDRAFT_3169 [Piloderma croceum F 1598]